MIAGYLWVTTEEEKNLCHSVREKVFIEEQGFSKENEFDIIDGYAHHLLFLDDNQPVGTARLYEQDGEWHIGRVAALNTYRGKGVGKFLMMECIQKARELDPHKLISLSAQEQAAPFYEKLGFVKEGQPYFDEHCPHIRMVYQEQE